MSGYSQGSQTNGDLLQIEEMKKQIECLQARMEELQDNLDSTNSRLRQAIDSKTSVIKIQEEIANIQSQLRETTDNLIKTQNNLNSAMTRLSVRSNEPGYQSDQFAVSNRKYSSENVMIKENSGRTPGRHNINLPLPIGPSALVSSEQYNNNNGDFNMLYKNYHASPKGKTGKNELTRRKSTDEINRTKEDFRKQFKKKEDDFSDLTPPSSHVNQEPVDITKFIISYDDLKCDKIIGSGGFAEVWIGKYIPENLTVAIKKIRPRDDKDKVEQSYMSEVNTLASLRNPFLLQFVGYTKTEPYCVVTKYMPNGSLYSALRPENESDNLTQTQIAIIAYGIALGMNYLHEKGIIHRDLKSQNVLLDDNYYPVICDFGSCRNKNTIRTFTGQGGTANYMAPEFMKAEKYDEKIDVYSYGILLWELVTKQSPFEGLIPPQIVCTVSMFNRRPDIPPDTNPLLKHLIENCWDRDPKERPPFADILKYLCTNNGCFDGVDVGVFQTFISQHRSPFPVISYASAPKPKHRSFVGSLSPVSEPSHDINSQIEARQLLNNNFATLADGNANQISTAISYILGNVDDPAIFTIAVWQRVLVLLLRAPPSILPRAKELALTLAKNQEILALIEQVHDLNLFVKPETLDVFLYVFNFFSKVITTDIVTALVSLSKNKQVSLQAITLLCKAHSLSPSHAVIQACEQFFIGNILDFANIPGGHLVVRTVVNIQRDAITDEVFKVYVQSEIIENITAAYQILFVRKLSPGLLTPALLNHHIVLSGRESSKEIDELIETALNFTRMFAMQVRGEILDGLIMSLLSCVIERRVEHAALLLCAFAIDPERKLTFLQPKFIDRILSCDDDNGSSMLMRLVLLFFKDDKLRNAYFTHPKIFSYLHSVVLASNTDSFLSVCWVIVFLPPNPAFTQKLIDVGCLQHIINAICSTKQEDFIAFVVPTLMRFINEHDSPAYEDLTKHMLQLISDGLCLDPCLKIIKCLLKYESQQNLCLKLNIVSALSKVNDPQQKKSVKEIFEILKSGVLQIE
ncbi:TKL family protein kinase [Trichomonas vaginalis G3]|uniref:TKL family protein kinase n=1 Tax=Trichomonas vaginalis (strain ATCC PRA-98 / G3) TaxID=412133 RepID=A2G0Z0_TRIV3|nr:protein kinase protein [Trichomonas vaginalis G3]EAX89180.1 TKL family protein kinase [Trichomonas vaginalis G3]KAI5500841.1 protein kinase protein [Trichomonas vaginalis G3]|eukprot:XP_001302110.1 TKL family protein kinase [Trichomonas vaginalis G3]